MKNLNFSVIVWMATFLTIVKRISTKFGSTTKFSKVRLKGLKQSKKFIREILKFF